MANKWFDNRKLGVRIVLGIVVGALGIGMLLYLVPGQGGTEVSSADVVATVGDSQITITDVRQQLDRIERGGQLPAAMAPLYAQQVLKQLVMQHALDLEADRLGLRVTDEDRRDRIVQLVPTAFQGDTFVGMDQYAAAVQERFQMGVPEFEELVRQSLVEQKFEQLVTDGITVTPQEVQQEFRWKNEKIKIEYIVIKPDDLQGKIDPSDADLAAYFEKNKAKYVVPEKRVVQYIAMDPTSLASRVTVTEDDERAYYQSNLDKYHIDDRVHVAHILFKTVGKTDAEVAEIQKTAEAVDEKAKHGGDFGALAKQYSEDTTKDAGGDLGWIVRGQTVPEFEQAAFSLPVGSVSDLVRTQYGFHIIHVIERQMARTQSFDEVKADIATALQAQKSQEMAETLSSQIAEDIRRGGRVPLSDIAKKYGLTLQESQPMAQSDTLPGIGAAPDVQAEIFQERADDVSAPLHTDTGYVIVSVKQIQPAHPATLAEVHDAVLQDYRHDKAVDQAKQLAADIAQRSKAGQTLDAIAKSDDLQVKTSDSFARDGEIPDAGSARQFAAAFDLPLNQTGDPIFLGANWVVYRVVDHTVPSQDDFTKQEQSITQDLLQSKREAAYDAFREALQQRLEQEGKIKYIPDNMKRLTAPG
ncbi:MAG: peptidyl-prolyl cis-trans isomerase [Candidatus Acidiferrales bacterium]